MSWLVALPLYTFVCTFIGLMAYDCIDPYGDLNYTKTQKCLLGLWYAFAWPAYMVYALAVTLFKKKV